MRKITVEIFCTECRGTGVYRGYAEEEGIGVICASCNGKGGVDFTYTPFTGRRRREDTHTVRNRFSESCVPYDEFLAGVMPE